MKKRLSLLLLLFLLTVFSFGEIIYVPSNYLTIQEAINASANDDTVLVSPGTYVENINFNSKNITLSSLFYTTQDTSYISQTVIDGNQNGTVVIIESFQNITLSGFTITNGYLDNGYENEYGAGIICRYGVSANLEGNIIIYNNSQYDGGGISFDEVENVNLEKTKIVYNSAYRYGGGIYTIKTNIKAKKLEMVNNMASTGGGIYCFNSILKLENVTLANNFAEIYGGGIFCYSTTYIDVVNSIFWENHLGEICLAPSNFLDLKIGYSNISPEKIYDNNNSGNIIWLEGCINENPLFINHENENYHLQENSPCIDAGTAYLEYEGEILINLEENEYIGIAPDMGAYEYEFVNLEQNELIENPLRISNYPNPFNPETIIKFTLPKSNKVELAIYNTKGQKINFLINNYLEAGKHSITWNARNLPSGIYFYKMKFGKYTSTKKMILMK